MADIHRRSSLWWVGFGAGCCLFLLWGPIPVSHGAVPEAAEAPYGASYLRGDYQEALDRLEKEGGVTAGGLPLDWAMDRANLLSILGRGDEALVAMHEVAQSIQEPWYTMRLAELLLTWGHRSEADQAMQWALQQNQAYYQRQQFPERNLLAMGRLARLRGENPNRVLQIYQQRLLTQYSGFVEGFVEAGELALASHGYDVAEGYFLEALTRQPQRQDALAGLAETYWKAGDHRLDEVCQKIVALNPHHPRVQSILADQRLMAGDSDGAREIVDAILAINPSHRRGLAYRAAIAFLEDDLLGQNEALEQLAHLDPTRGDGYLVVGEVAARHYRFEEAVALLRTGGALEPDHRDLQAALGLNLLRLGDDAAGRAVLETAFQQDRFNVQVYNMLEVLDSTATFETLQSPDFEIQLPKEEAVVMGRALQSVLAEGMAYLAPRYNVAVKTPVHIQLFDDHDEFMVRSVGLPGNPGHLGICFGALVTLDSPRARVPRSMNWRAVLWHEFVHVITLQKSNNRIPRWLSEGISVYEEGQRDPAWGQPLQPEFAALVDWNALPTIADLEPLFVRPESPDHLMLGYFLAGAFVESYVADFGLPALNRTLEEIGAGKDGMTALSEAAGEASSALDERFAKALRRVCKPLTYLHRDAPPAYLIPKLPRPSFYRTIEAGKESAAAGNIPEAIARWEEAATLYPDFPGEENPLRQLVHLYQESGDHGGWTTALERLREMDATAYTETHAYLAHAAETGAWSSVLELVDWCRGIDPFDLSLYTYRRQAEEALGHQESLLETLTVLTELDEPNAATYQLAHAKTLMMLGDRDAARRGILTVLERFPEYRHAQEVLLALHGAETGGVDHGS